MYIVHRNVLWGRVNAGVSEKGRLLMGEMGGELMMRLWMRGEVLLRQMHGDAIPGKKREGVVENYGRW